MYILNVQILNMTKKEYILAVIDALPKWEMWRGIKAMVQNNQLNEETIDKLVIIFKKVVKEITDSFRKNNVQENLQAVQNLSQQKAEQEKKDKKTLQELDSKLNNL